MAVLIIAVASSMTACRRPVSDDIGPVEHRGLTQALNATPPEPDISFELLFPSGLGLSDVAVGASEDLDLGPKIRIVGIQGAPGRIAVAGVSSTRETVVGAGTTVGDIASVPPVLLQPKATAASVRSTGAVTLKPNASAASVASNVPLTPLGRRQIRIHPPTGPGLDLQVAQHASTTLTPGRYPDGSPQIWPHE